jgi:two-component system, LytTR family, sensor kinase
VIPTPQSPRFTRWLAYAGLWVLLVSVFASQLYLAGYVTPWPRAFAAEAIYWLAWWILVPAVFWWCRRLRGVRWSVRAPALLFGALLSLMVAPLIAQSLHFVQIWLRLCVGECEPALAPFSGPWFGQAIRAAGVNLPVYAGFVLAWHAASYYREARDRQMRAVELEGLLHQSQLEALRSQLNPHFLFNALHSMAELVHTDPKLAEQLIVRLGELLRQVLQSSNRQEVPLSEELEFIRGYIEIEQMRLGDRLQVRWDVDVALAQLRVPSLVLQPLVENAIQHGIAAASGPGTLTIWARRHGDYLHLEVRDTGPGPARGPSERSQGIGLANTRARLQRLYGDDQKFEIQTGSGMTVKLCLPASPA